MAMGLTEWPSAPLRKGINDDAHKNGATAGGRDPETANWTKLDRARIRAVAPEQVLLLTRSCKWAGRSPEGPGQTPKEIS